MIIKQKQYISAQYNVKRFWLKGIRNQKGGIRDKERKKGKRGKEGGGEGGGGEERVGKKD